MCTVSFIKKGSSIIITSNRDENINRPPAEEISSVEAKQQTLFFPKDALAGGTWFVITTNGTIAVLLNGAFEKHKPSYPYIKSRGIVLLELMSDNAMPASFKKIALDNIEPFTIIYYEKDQLYELRWDGSSKHNKQLSTTQSHIWSSATLYNTEIRQWREDKFHNFIASQPNVDEKVMTDFHLQSYDDNENGFVMKRDNGIQTRSVTQVVLANNSASLVHHILDTNTTIDKTISILS